MIESLDELRAFVQIAESGRMVAAAKALRWPPMKVGRLLTALERRLGMRLFHRTTRSISITPDGRRLYEKALRVLAAVDDIQNDVVSRPDDVAGTLKIAVRTTSVYMGFMKYLLSALEQHPRLSVQLWVTDEPVDVVAGGFDISVQLGPLKDSSLRAKYLGDVHFVLAASPLYVERHGAPESPEDLVNHECVRSLLVPAVTDWSLADRKGNVTRVPVQGRLECNDVRARAEALYAGVGIMPRPLAEVRDAVKANTLVRILPEYSITPFSIYAIMPPRRPKSKQVELGLKILADLMNDFQ